MEMLLPCWFPALLKAEIADCQGLHRRVFFKE